MIGKVRRTRLIARGSEPLTRRDPQISLVFVATEDTYAAKQYLDALQERGLVDRSRVEIIALPTLDNRSSLVALLDRLKEHQEKFAVHLTEDQCWAVFDVDHHKAEELSTAAEVATNRGYRLAGSNPCFELWLLLHLTDDVTGLASSSKNRHAARACEKRLHETLQDGDPRARGYDKNRIGAERFAVLERVQVAIARARARATATREPWPTAVGTQVYALIEGLPKSPALLDE